MGSHSQVGSLVPWTEAWEVTLGRGTEEGVRERAHTSGRQNEESKRPKCLYFIGKNVWGRGSPAPGWRESYGQLGTKGSWKNHDPRSTLYVKYAPQLFVLDLNPNRSVSFFCRLSVDAVSTFLPDFQSVVPTPITPTQDSVTLSTCSFCHLSLRAGSEHRSNRI